MPQTESWREPRRLPDPVELNADTLAAPSRAPRLEPAADRAPARSLPFRNGKGGANFGPSLRSEFEESHGGKFSAVMELPKSAVGRAAPAATSAALEDSLGCQLDLNVLSGLIHDARNMVSALELYCDLLEEPGVLGAPYRHYAGELRRVGAANRRLLEGLAQLGEAAEASSPILPRMTRGVAPERQPARRLRSRWLSGRTNLRVADGPLPGASAGSLVRNPEIAPKAEKGNGRPEGRKEAGGNRQQFLSSGQPVANLAAELRANHNLLAALVGHSVTLGMSIEGGSHPIAMTADDLTRVLVNLARNAAEAMPGGGHLQITLEEGLDHMTLSFSDNGPGIPEEALESIFTPGFSSHVGLELEREAENGAWPVQHRGLGLSIVRSLVAAAGGAVWAANREQPRLAVLADGDSRPRGTPAGGAAGRAPVGGAAGYGVGSGAPREARQGSSLGAVILIEFPISRLPEQAENEGNRAAGA